MAIQTKYGGLRGVTSRDGTVVSYKGVPFAQPPVGELRFAPPRPPIPWEGELICDGFRPACIQPARRGFGGGPAKIYWTSEDCLYLNVWTPANAKAEDNLPVMLWIYGGGFIGGRTADPEMDGAALAKQGVILVTCAYRCGPLGFFALSELARRVGAGGPRNLGLLDQIAALEWVHENISAFGGDPDNITLFGQSAGGMSTRMLLCAPPTKGLIRRVIVHSGGGLNEGDPVRPTAEMEDLCKQTLAHLGWTVDDLMTRDANEVTAKLLEASKVVASHELHLFQPFIDGYSITDVPGKLIKEGKFPENVSLMCGTVSGDSWMFSRKVRPQLAGDEQALRGFAYSPAVAWARVQNANGRVPLYGYFFEHLRPGQIAVRTPDGAAQLLSPHGSEIAYAFGNLDCGDDRTDFAWTEYDYTLSDAMVRYWTNFARTGDPNGDGLPPWTPYTQDAPRVMNFRDDGWDMRDVVDDPRAEHVIRYTIDHPGMLEKFE